MNYRNNKAFTMLELLLALALAGFVILAMMQAYKTLMSYLERVRFINESNRSAVLMINQLERDLSAACIPFFYEKVEPEKNGDFSGKKDGPVEQNKKKEKSIKDFFMVEIDNADLHRVQGKRVELLKTLSFVTTNPLESFNQQQTKFVRICYELVKDKKNSRNGRSSYRLLRKETLDIANVLVKVSEVDANDPARKYASQTQVIGENLKGIYIKFIGPIEKENQSKEEVAFASQEMELFHWGSSKDSEKAVPWRADVIVEWWDNVQKDVNRLHTVIPLFVFQDYELLKDTFTLTTSNKRSADKQAFRENTKVNEDRNIPFAEQEKAKRLGNEDE